MADRPILFSAPMVRAILAGTKTQTRRVVKPGTPDDWNSCPYGGPNTRLWVRETHMDLGACYLYRADASAEQERALVAPGQRWRPSIHMPRAASRITLEVADVRVERLQDISEADAVAEGVPNQTRLTGYSKDGGCQWGPAEPVAEYCSLWEQINGPGSWDANPLVWVVKFRRIEQTTGGAA